MLDAGGQAVRLAQVIPLEASHLGDTQVSGQQGILSAGLHHPAPPGLPAVVHHGGEGHLDATGCGLFGRHPGAGFGQRRVEGTAQPQGDGEDGSVAVDDIHHKEHGNFVPIPCQMNLLHLLHFLGGGEVQHAAQATQVFLRQSELLHGPGDARAGVHEHIGVVLHELADFFLQGHLG